MEYPSLKVAADAASQSAQRTFLRLNIAQLLVLVCIAAVSGWGPPSPDSQRVVAIIVAVLMFAALALATSLRLGKFDDRWFRCRALAENVKSACWFFVMSPANSLATSEATYLKEIEQLQNRLEQVSKEVSLYDSAGGLVTEPMKGAQKLSLEQKLVLYRENRLEDQRLWYHKKAQANIRLEKQWFWGIFVIEFAAVAYAALQA
jgi:hypothetical protein